MPDGVDQPKKQRRSSRLSNMLKAITNARVVTPEEVINGATVTFEEGKISGILRRVMPVSQETPDARGGYLLPGLVDLHSDAIEKHLSPRPGVEFSPETALLEMDNYFLSSGVTTGFHAISFRNNNVTSSPRSRELCEVVQRFRGESLAHHELHLRCEIPEDESVEAVEQMILHSQNREVGLVSIMDHTPGQGQFRNLEWFRRYWVEDSGADESQVAAAIEEAQMNGHNLAMDRVERLARAANRASLVLASHDDDSSDRVEMLAEKGVGISEFPINVESARRARELGLSVCMGAPNVVRGVSSGGNLCATEAVHLGLVDALCSDYHPPSMLRAAFILARNGTVSLPAAVGLISKGPARAAGMLERGEIREGGLADVIVVGERLRMHSASQVIVEGKVKFALHA